MIRNSYDPFPAQYRKTGKKPVVPEPEPTKFPSNLRGASNSGGKGRRRDVTLPTLKFQEKKS